MNSTEFFDILPTENFNKFYLDLKSLLEIF